MANPQSNTARKAAAKKATPAKRAPAKKAPAKATEPDLDDGSAAEAAAAEVDLENEPIKVPFRGMDFTVDPVARRSGRYALALASAQWHIAITELLDVSQIPRFIALCERGEELGVVAAEFFDALSEASKQGNS